MDFVSIIDEYARTQPERVALRAAGQDWTYAELAQTSRRAATVLHAQGVGAGDHVALWALNTPGFVFALFGAWRLGAAVVPVNHKLQAPEVAYILQHAAVRLCLVDGSLAGLVDRIDTDTRWLSLDSTAAGMDCFDELLAQAGPHTDDSAAPGEQTLAEILYTSGTTGKPKGCLHSHGNLFHTALCAAVSTSLTWQDRTLIAMPIWHSSPLNNWTLGTLLVGGTVVLQREYAPQAFIETLAAERITFAFAAPIALLAPLQMVPNLADYDLSAMRLFTYGGGPLGADMARKLVAGYGTDRFMQVYGMTESGPLGSVLFPEEAIAKAGSIGRRGTVGVQLQVRRADDSLCTAGEVGEIHMKSAGMMQGYLDDAEATAAAFDADGWYRSGDMARVDEDGYLYIVDRKNDMIVTGGENVYSREVEDVLSAYPDIADVAVIGRPHPEWGETVTAFVQLKPDCTLDEDAIRAFAEARLARYKIPRIWQVRETLPRTASGKLLKHKLRAQIAGN